MAIERSDDVRNHFVYRVFGAQDRLLYIGCTQNLTARWIQHRFDNRHWTDQMERIKVQGPFCWRKARELEAAAVKSESPAYGWTPERGFELRQKKQWKKTRLQELMGRGKRPSHFLIDAYIALDDAACREADAKFPNLWNSDNHPIHGVPEEQQPFVPRDKEPAA